MVKLYKKKILKKKKALEEIKQLFKEAKQIYKKDKKKSNNKIKKVKRLSLKYKIRLTLQIKRKICKNYNKFVVFYVRKF